MNYATILILLIFLPAIIGVVIAALNADEVNGMTEKIEAWIRRKQADVAIKGGWHNKYIIRPMLWTLINFGDWTDSFSHRGTKNGVRVAISLYLLEVWCVILYIAFAIVLLFVVLYMMLIMFSGMRPSTIPCRACGHAVSTNAKYCPSCGEDFTTPAFDHPTISCRACGHDVSTEAKRCPSCGEDLKDLKLFGGKTVSCRVCGYDVSTDAKRCSSCGEDFTDVKIFNNKTVPCRACGHEVSPDAKRCPSCGENLREIKVFNNQTVSCRACGHDVSLDARHCPSCNENFA